MGRGESKKVEEEREKSPKAKPRRPNATPLPPLAAPPAQQKEKTRLPAKAGQRVFMLH